MPRRVFAILLVCAAVLVAYSQTQAFAWDEGFHLLTAQLIQHGNRPYIDFVFSQTPLNAYWNAAWLAIAGETWRVPHAVAALCSAGAVTLVAGFVLSRFPLTEWRVPGAVIAALMVGLNVLVVRYGGIAQAYGLCLLAVTAAWRLSVTAAEKPILVFAALAGLMCGVAANSSLLTASVTPILLIWIMVRNREGSGPAKAAAFLLGEAVACVPVLWLFVQWPRQVWFGIVEYNLLYRQLGWPDATRQNFEVLTSWINSGDALLLILLAGGGLLFVRFRSGWEPGQKAEFYLCAWLVCGLALHIATVRPTFERYFIFTVPFLAVLALAGLVSVGKNRPGLTCAVLAALLSVALARSLYNEREAMTWHDIEGVAAAVTSATTPNQTLFADEAVYFLTRHSPPSGMEMRDSHKFDFPAEKLALLHLIPWRQLDARVHSGFFDTLETCEDADYIREHGYGIVYGGKTEVGECTVFHKIK